MAVKYEPNYSSREAYYANKDRAVAERLAEKAKRSSLFERVRACLFPPAREPKVHDYRGRCWGHDVFMPYPEDGGKKGKMIGWGCGIEAGDFLILSHSEGWASYRVDEIEYNADPPDMWHARVTWTPGVFEVRDGEIVRCERS